MNVAKKRFWTISKIMRTIFHREKNMAIIVANMVIQGVRKSKW